jgi:hypothetical protein
MDLLDDRSGLTEIPREQLLAVRPPLAELIPEGNAGDRAERNRRMRRAHVDFGYSLKASGDFLGIHYATVSRVVKKVEEEMSGTKTSD